MAHERAKGWKIRRTLASEAFGLDLPERYEWLKAFNVDSYDAGVTVFWCDDPIDAMLFTQEHLAQMTRDELRSRNNRVDVIYHAVVEV